MNTIPNDAVEASPLVPSIAVDGPVSPGLAKSNRAVKLLAGLAILSAAAFAATKAYNADSVVGAPVLAAEKSPADGILAVDPIGNIQREALRNVLFDVGTKNKIIFGHENSNREGQHFWDNAGQDMHSDVFNTTGQYPGMYGFSFQDIINGADLTHHVLNAARQNAIIEFFWEANNPTNDGTARDATGYPCKALLPGESANEVWNGWMDIIADSVARMQIGGTKIPMILRLFHENTESWYWWGDTKCDAINYKAAWNYTRWYLTEHKGLENMLLVYAPAKVSETEWNAYTSWYPGDDQVDIIGFDRYGKAAVYSEYAREDCKVACDFAAKVGKPCALAETGIADGIQTIGNRDWFMANMLDNLMDTGTSCTNLTYMLTWANEQPDRYWVPLPYQTTAAGFIQMVEDTRTIMAGDKSFSVITKENGYGFKNPGDYSDLHGEDDGSPEPIGYEDPANGYNGIKANVGPTNEKPFEEGYDYKDWGPFEWTDDRLAQLPEHERLKVKAKLLRQ